MKIPGILKPEREDFMPILVGGAMLIMATPGFLMVFFLPDPGSGGFATVVLVLLGVLGAIGAALIIAGVRACSDPGSLAYRLAYFRLLPRFRRRGRLRA
ncbi:MAG TPA: hypothetical protein VFX06_16110 [Stellaceae bacterium]|jgi:hypothetical protein|nr:hypothetical protein [Stellaceae bacterium]